MKHSPGFRRIVDDAKTRIREVTVDDVKGMLDRGEPFELVDTREESEFARGHLPRVRELVFIGAIGIRVADREGLDR